MAELITTKCNRKMQKTRIFPEFFGCEERYGKGKKRVMLAAL